MAGQLQLDVVTPDKLVLSKRIEYVGAPGLEGEFGVLPGHALFLSALGVGSLMYKVDGRAKYLFISGGFAEVTASKVTILAEVAELPEEIDVDRAERAKERALKRLESERRERIDYARAHSALQRAIMRMKTRENAKV